MEFESSCRGKADAANALTLELGEVVLDELGFGVVDTPQDTLGFDAPHPLRDGVEDAVVEVTVAAVGAF